MNKGIFLGIAAALGLFAASAACASPVTFFGQDLDPGTSTANSDTAHAQFLSNLVSGVGTESFESFTPGSYPTLNVTFPGSTGNITATLTGSDDEIENGPDGAGRFPVSGSQYLVTDQGFNLAFSAPISAFGFYGTDIGDFGGQLILTLTGGATQTITIPSAVGSNGSTDGNELFFGFIDPTQSYTNIAFADTAAGTDFFGFDDMTIGDLGQVHLNVPEPGELGLFGLGVLLLGGFVALRRRIG